MVRQKRLISLNAEACQSENGSDIGLSSAFASGQTLRAAKVLHASGSNQARSRRPAAPTPHTYIIIPWPGQGL